MANIIDLTWRDINENELGHRVYRNTMPIDTTALPAVYAELGVNSQQFVDNDVVFGETYYYVVGAFNDTEEVFSNNIVVQCREPIYVTTYNQEMQAISVDGTVMKTTTVPAATNGETLEANTHTTTGLSDVDRNGNQFYTSSDRKRLIKVDSDLRHVWTVEHPWDSIENVRCDLLGNIVLAVRESSYDAYVYFISNETGDVISKTNVVQAIVGSTSTWYTVPNGLHCAVVIPTKNPNYTLAVFSWLDHYSSRQAGILGLSPENGVVFRNPVVLHNTVQTPQQTQAASYTLQSWGSNETVVLDDGRIVFAGRYEWYLISPEGMIEVYKYRPISGNAGYTESIVQMPDSRIWGFSQGYISELSTATLDAVGTTVQIHTADGYPSGLNGGLMSSIATDYDGNMYLGSYYSASTPDGARFFLIKYDPYNHKVLWTHDYGERPVNVNPLPGRIFQDLGKH